LNLKRWDRVSVSVARPERPRKSLSWILYTFLRSVARVPNWTPNLRSLAIATHSLPAIATVKGEREEGEREEGEEEGG